MHDVLQRFLFNEAPVRGALIRLDQAWQEILSHHAYPPRLRDLLGELLAAGATRGLGRKIRPASTLRIKCCSIFSV